MFKREFLTWGEYNNFVKAIERHVRQSPEYKDWIKVIRNQGGYKCVICGYTLSDVTIEIHHHPFTLYDLAEYALIRLNANSLICAHFVLSLHLKNQVGWVPLCTTHHLAYHNQKLTIPTSLIRGNYLELYNNSLLPEEIRQRARKKLTIGGDDERQNNQSSTV